MKKGNIENKKKIEWILRIALFGEFLWHGIFALQLKEKFVEMLIDSFSFIGISIGLETAGKFMLLVGGLDIFVAILALAFPFRLLFIWASIWGFLTALARPISGDPIWDFVERWANVGVPLALLYLRGLPRKFKELFR